MRRLILAAGATAGLAAGCGTPSADLFVVERRGDLPAAQLTLRVSDGGWATCDGGERRALPNDVLLDARTIARDVQPLLEAGRRLPARPGSVLRYRVTGEGGTATFADNSPGAPVVLARLAALTRRIARDACGRPR